jgi:hypothetical protein
VVTEPERSIVADWGDLKTYVRAWAEWGQAELDITSEL